MVANVHSQARSWRKAARILNELYSVSLSHATWWGYAKGKHDIADPETRARLLLPVRACPSCGHKQTKRKRTESKRIRMHGYQVKKVKTIFEMPELQNAPR